MNAILIVVVTLVLQLLLIAAVFWKMPDWSRPEILFSVTVPADVRRSTEGQAIIAGFRHRLVATGVGALVLSLLPLLVADLTYLVVVSVMLIMLAYIGAVLWAFLWARGRAAALAVPPSGKREALVSPRRQALPGGRWLQSGPFLLFGAVFSGLAWSWATIPDRFVTHWDSSFQPDGFSDKTLGVVFGPPAIGLALCAMVPVLAWSLLNRSRQVHVRGVAAQLESRRRSAVAELLLWVEYFLVAIFAPLALTPFAQTPTAAKTLTFGVVGLASFGSVGMLVVWFVRHGAVLTAQSRGAEVTADSAPIGDRTEDRHWKWGLVYFNPQDPVVWVEKRFGIGYTFNMARPAAWSILAAMIGIPLALALALALLT